jgi:hypothetical protein
MRKGFEGLYGLVRDRLLCEFSRGVRLRKFVELPSVVVIEVRFDDSMLRPPVNRLLVDAEAISCLSQCP